MISSSFDDRRWTTRTIDGKKVRVRTDYRGKKPWRARWREYPGAPQQYTPYVATKTQAQQDLVEVQHRLLSGTYVDAKAGRIALRSYAESWFKRRESSWSRQHRDRVERELRLHILPELGDRPLGSFQTHHVEEWAVLLTKPRADRRPLMPSSVKTVHSTLVTIFNAAVKDGRLAKNAAESAVLPKVVSGKFVPLTVVEAQMFVLGLPQHVRAAGVLDVGTGMRQGELFGITVDRVNFQRGRLRIDRQLITPDGEPPRLAPLKTPNSNRTITLAPLLVHALNAHLDVYPRQRCGVDDEEFLFHSGERPISRSMRNNYAIRAAGKTSLPDTRWHDMRHHHASVLLSSGINPAAVADRLGDTVAEIMKTYDHVMPDDDERMLSVINETLGESIESWLSPEASDDEAIAG